MRSMFASLLRLAERASLASSLFVDLPPLLTWAYVKAQPIIAWAMGDPVAAVTLLIALAALGGVVWLAFKIRLRPPVL